MDKLVRQAVKESIPSRPEQRGGRIGGAVFATATRMEGGYAEDLGLHSPLRRWFLLHWTRTTDLPKRIVEHQSGEGCDWTKNRLPVALVFEQEMWDDSEAFQAEHQIKRWSRAKKEALIAGDAEMLRWLAGKPKYRK